MPLRKLLIIIGVALAAGVLYLATTRSTPYPITNEHPAGTQIIAFGDSLTSGYGADDTQSYPAQLARRLGIPIFNKGKPGDTTATALDRLDGDVLGNDPRIVLVCLGGNDVLQHLPREKLIGNLELIVRRIQERGALVIVVGLDVINDSRLAGEYAALARRTGCPFVPDVLGGIFGHPDLMSDPVHPNGAGYALMAAKIEPVLKKYLASQPPIAYWGSGAGGLML